MRCADDVVMMCNNSDLAVPETPTLSPVSDADSLHTLAIRGEEDLLMPE